MSQRVKRSLKSEDGPVPTKRRKGRPTMDEDDSASIADSMGAWASRTQDSIKPPNIYNRTVAEAPAELFRKDLISAMKLADSEPLTADEYWVIGDQWKQEWERGVQVPVNPDSLPGPSVTLISNYPVTKPGHEFKLPKNKYVAICKDDSFDPETHVLSDTPARAEKACSYDLDDTDAAWLQIFNGERATMGLMPIKEDQLERVMEELEMRCWDKIQTKVKNEESLGIEYDENVICDVCRSPDSEESNEMVFCDSCNICVHQACYGITTIPSGQWLCRTCALGKRPECVLCPNKMGAMKSTQSGSKWAHVSCALWIPEVSIGSVEKMEPITKISSIPQSRWALICVLCRERVGACIQCSVKSCKTAYHVTCAFKHGLEMKAIIEDDAADDGVKLRSYCQKHSVTSKDKKSSASSEDDESKRKKRKDMTSEERSQARAAKLQEIEAEFDKHVSHTDVKQCLDVDPEGILYIYNYWKLKRRAGGNRPLLAPKSDDVDLLSQKQEQADLDKMRMFVQLRQDLERVRNLCYMVSRREKLSRSFFNMREKTFHKQAAVLSDPNCSLSPLEVQAVIEANHGPTIYDRLYSHTTSETCSLDFDVISARITGLAVPEDDEKPKTSELNGLVRSSGGRRSGMDNPYKRMYNGGTRRRSSIYNSMSSGSETDKGAQRRKDSRLGLDSSASSTEDDKLSLERKPLRDRNESKTTSPSPSKSTHKTSRAAMLGLDSGASSTEEEKASARKGSRRRSSLLSSKLNEESACHPLSSKTASRLASLGLDSGGSSSEEEKAKHEETKKSRGWKKSNLSVKKGSEKDKSSSKAATIARLGLDSNASSSEDEKPIRKLSTDATAPSKRRGRKLPVTPARVRKDSSSDEELIRPAKSKESELRNNVKRTESDIKMSVSEDSDNDLLIRPSSKTDNKKLSSAIYSDSDSDASRDESSSNMTADHHQNMMRTKGAMKEFSGAPSKSGSKSPKKSSKSKGKDDESVDELSKDKENVKNKKKENVATDLIVPQRQAAKKASESIQKVSQGRLKDFELEREFAQKPSPAESEKKTKAKSKAKDEEKKSKSGREAKSAPDIYEFDKDPDAAEILAYVPQRQAAKKANEHMKTSIKKTEKDLADVLHVEKAKKEPEVDKSKKTSKPEPRPKKLSKSSSSSSSSSTSSTSSSSSSSGTSSSSSDSDSDSRSKSPAKKDVKTEKAPEPLSELKKVTAKKEEWPFLDKVSKSSESSSLDSDSDSDKDKDIKRPTTRPKQSSKEKESSSSQLAGKKFRKAPDKKLKTSDGRPELELQQPPSERDEPFLSKEKLGGTSRASSGDPSDRLRSPESRSAERRSGNLFDIKEPTISRESQQGRGRPRSKGAEESPRDRGRTGKQDSAAQKDQPKPGKRKSEEGKESSPLGEFGSPVRRSETSRRGTQSSSPSKEENKSKCSPAEVKKVSKKIELQSPERDVERRKSARHTSGDVLKNLSGDNSAIDSKSSHSPSSDIHGPSFRSPKMGPSESTIGLRHEEESLVKTMNSILAPGEKDLSVITSKRTSPRVSVAEKSTLEESRASTSSSSSSSSVSDDSIAKDKAPEVLINTLPSEKSHASEEIENKISDSVLGNPKSCGLETSIDFTCSEQENVEPKKINSRSSSLSGAPYQQRSIFSPQQPKDSGVSDLFDFQNDLYAVDDSVNDDGFGIPNSEEIMRAPLQFTFNNELLFKDDSKEDTTRETLNLVDKLRLSYAQQKSQPGSNDLPETPSLPAETVAEQMDPDIEVLPMQPKPPVEEVNLTEENNKHQVCADDVPVSVASMQEHDASGHLAIQANTSQVPLHNKHEVPVYPSTNTENSFSGYSCAVEANMSKTVPGTQIIDSSKNVQADERWVPPSGIGYPGPSKEIEQPSPHGLSAQLQVNLGPLTSDPIALSSQSQHPKEILMVGSQNEIPQPALHQADLEKPSKHHDQPSSVPVMGHDQFENMNQTPRMDSPSRYSDLHSQAKWADSQVLPVRRNSTTSDDTDSEEEAHNDVEPLPTPAAPAPPTVCSDLMAPYQAATLSYPSCPVPETPYNPYSEAAGFVNPVPMFPPPAFPGPNIPSMYPPPYGTFQDHGMMPPMASKPEEPQQQVPAPCTAAFTSSSHNMAFTAAMVSPLPTATPTPSPVLPQDPPLTPAAFPTSTAPPTPSPVLPHDTQPASTPFSSQTSLDSQTFISATEHSHQLHSVTSQSSKVVSSVGKKTPTKPTRSSPRVISLQQKSPAKSPGKSPRQLEPVVVKPPVHSRSTAGSSKKATKVPRGGNSQPRSRGRAKGKGRGGHHGFDEFGICSKLAGTVYDLDFDDDDGAESVENLRAMRERRKSSDYHDRKGSESSYQSQDSALSPKFSSPSHVSSKQRSTIYQNQNLSGLRPPSPVHDGPSVVDEDDDMPVSPDPEETSDGSQMQSLNECVLPGPVDMRTYSSFETQPATSQPASFLNNPLGSLASDQQEPDVAEDVEKEIQHAAKEKEKPIEEPRVSLPDSRQQLKFKIKGPFLDANYVAAAPTVAPMSQQQQPAMPAVAPLDSMQGTGMSSGSAMASVSASGTSNLRRMRKKELLRQYCSQDMNMDDAGAQAMIGNAVQPAPPINRNVISIPKAVASMTTIPTREDYKAVVDANMEKKRRKDKTPNFSNSYARRNNPDGLEYDDSELLSERRRSVGSNGSNSSFPPTDASQPLKRRGRAPRNASGPSAEMATPKLKIKIGGNCTEVLSNPVSEKKNLRVRPPKKRHTAPAPAPSLEELRAESMKYRKMIMKDFGWGEDDKEEPVIAPPVPKKKKKKKNKSSRSSSPAPLPVVPEVQVITNEIAAPKLIIRFGNKGSVSANSGTSISSGSVSNVTVTSGDMGTLSQERTSDGMGRNVGEKQLERLYLTNETQPPVRTDDIKDVQQAAARGTDLDGSQNSDATALRRIRTPKSTIPKLKLKLARCEDGYVMQPREETVSNLDGQLNDVEPPPENVHNMTEMNSSTLPLSQDCEVR